MSNPSFAKNADHELDELVVGHPVKTRVVDVTDNQSQGALTRGAVLGELVGVYARVHQTGSFPASTAKAILAQDVDPSGGTVQALVYEMADINEDQVNLGGTVVLADVREALRENGIFLKSPASN